MVQVRHPDWDVLSYEHVQGTSGKAGSSTPAVRLRAQIVDTILSSTTRLVANKAAWEDPQKRRKIEDVALLLKACTLRFPLFVLLAAVMVPLVRKFCSTPIRSCSRHCRPFDQRRQMTSKLLPPQAAINGKSKVGLKMNIHSSKLDDVCAALGCVTAMSNVTQNENCGI